MFFNNLVSEDERFYVNRLTSIIFNGKELVRYDYNGYGDLTAVYGRDGKKLRGFAYRNHIMVEHSQPDGLVSRYEYDRYDTDGKVLKSSNNLGEEWTFDYRKDHPAVTDALGQKCTVLTKTGNLDDVNIARVSCNLSAGSSGYVKERPAHNGETMKTPNREHCRTIHV